MPSSNDQKTSCIRVTPWGSLFATIVAVLGCILFIIFVADGIDGFLFQLNTLISANTSDIGKIIRSTLTKIGVIFGASAIIFFVISVFATSALATTPKPVTSVDDFDDNDDRPVYVKMLSSRKTVAVTILFAHFIFLFWLFVLCASAMILILYVAFFAGLQQFCVLLDNQCFDFKVMYPIVKKLTNNKIDMKLCAEKKGIMCDKNYLGEFILAFVCCMVSLVGIVHFMMCMSANYARLTARRTVKNGKHYAMNTGTVDTDSIGFHKVK